MPEGRHGDSDKFKPSYYGLRAFGWRRKADRLLEHRGHVRPRPLLVVFNSSSAFVSKLHPGASTTNCCCSYTGSFGGHFFRVPLFISVPTLPSASRDAGVQGRLSQFVSTGILMYLNVLCGLFYDAASVTGCTASVHECDSFFFLKLDLAEEM